MGVMRFLVHPPLPGDEWPEVFRGFVRGGDESVHPTRIEYDGRQITCRRPTGDNGRFFVAWPVAGQGRPTVGTASLCEREAPYLLPLELARGKVVQIRNQWAAWEAQGFTASSELTDAMRTAQALFSRAATSQCDEGACCDLAQQSLEVAQRVANGLAREYAAHSLAERFRKFPVVPSLLGCDPVYAGRDKNQDARFLEAFNAASIPVEWRTVEAEQGERHWAPFDEQVAWCQEHKLVIRGGPLFNFSFCGLPAWLRKWEHDACSVQCFIADFVETAIRRYLGRVRIWEVSAGLNSGGSVAFTEEHRLTLAAKTLELARQVDDESQFFLRIDQPWGEYQARGQHRLSPLHFADALVRAGLGLAGITLDIAVGFRPQGTPDRDLLEFVRLIDLWGTLQLPLHVNLAFPAAAGPDPLCDSELEADVAGAEGADLERRQAEWLASLLPVLIARPMVAGVFWSHLADAVPHRLPHAGLCRADGSPRPAYDVAARFRSQTLK